MKKLIILCVLLFAVAIIHAQNTDSLKYKYTNQTIYRYGGSFMKGTERLVFPALQSEFSMSELGLAFYTKAKKYRTTSIVLRTIALAASLSALAVISNNNLTNNRRNLAYGLLGGQLVFSIAAGRYGILSTQNLDKALWQRNKDLLFPAR
ncbi:MAG: hypothetical protein SGI96_15525 [Bacteroidota bacterium]|nr:hypothetical protein [Bacteroidota bacterium]